MVSAIGLVQGEGERRDCGRYARCLAEFVKRNAGRKRDPPAHCPPGCRGWRPAEASLEDASRGDGWAPFREL